MSSRGKLKLTDFGRRLGGDGRLEIAGDAAILGGVKRRRRRHGRLVVLLAPRRRARRTGRRRLVTAGNRGGGFGADGRAEPLRLEVGEGGGDGLLEGGVLRRAVPHPALVLLEEELQAEKWRRDTLGVGVRLWWDGQTSSSGGGSSELMMGIGRDGVEDRGLLGPAGLLLMMMLENPLRVEEGMREFGEGLLGDGRLSAAAVHRRHAAGSIVARLSIGKIQR